VNARYTDMPKDMVCLLENVLLETLKKLNMSTDLINDTILSQPAKIENKLFIIGPNHIWAPDEEMAIKVAEMIDQSH
jgi:hypothetical protein